jgi:hypothetical protein
LSADHRLYLRYEGSGWTKGEYLLEDEKKRRHEECVRKLDEEIDKSNQPRVIRSLLSWIFPQYERSSKQSTSRYSYVRGTSREVADVEKRICSFDYFPVYFRAAVPDEMFSNAELDRIISALNTAKTDTDARNAFPRALDSIPLKNPKREDFMRKLIQASDALNNHSAESLAYAVAERAGDYTYDMFHVGEAARAVNLVFTIVQKLSATSAAQRILTGSIARASDDTFAERILKFTENKDRNQILVDFSNIEVASGRKHSLKECATGTVKRMNVSISSMPKRRATQRHRS